MSQVKHFDAYNQETNRNTPQDDVIVDQRTLHEIYMPAFEAAVKRANVASVMCAYSSVNGNFSCQSPYLLTDVLSQEWDFLGFVSSDYGALHDTLGGAFAGLDQEQPFDTNFGIQLEDDVNNGTVPRAVLNTMVQRILTEMFRFNLFDHSLTHTPTATVTTPAHQGRWNRRGRRSRNAAQELIPHTADLRGPWWNGRGNRAVDVGIAHVWRRWKRIRRPVADGEPASRAPVRGRCGHPHRLPAGTSHRRGSAPDPFVGADAAYASTPFGGTYTGTLTAPETGTYVLALTNSCGCYTPTYLYLNGQELLDNPSTPPVSVCSVAVNLQAGQSYSIQITGDSSNFAWGTPSFLAPGIAQAVDAAKSASSAVVVVSDDTESEATDRPSLDLPSAQNELISAVAAANPHTTVVDRCGCSDRDAVVGAGGRGS
jgi:beta-glucosidase